MFSCNQLQSRLRMQEDMHDLGRHSKCGHMAKDTHNLFACFVRYLQLLIALMLRVQTWTQTRF